MPGTVAAQDRAYAIDTVAVTGDHGATSSDNVVVTVTKGAKTSGL